MFLLMACEKIYKLQKTYSLYSGKMQGSQPKGRCFFSLYFQKKKLHPPQMEIVCCWANESKDFSRLDGGNPLVSPFFLFGCFQK